MAIRDNLTPRKLVFLGQSSGAVVADDDLGNAFDNAHYEMGVAIFARVSAYTTGNVVFKLQESSDNITYTDVPANKIIHPQGSSTAVDAAGVTSSNLSESVTAVLADEADVIGLGVFSNARYIKAVAAEGFTADVELYAMADAEYPPV
jgi:hypothetical protein